jgi:hypothetical protein
VEGTEDPVAAILGSDPRAEFMFSAGDIVLLERSAERRRDPDDGGYWAVDLGSGSAIRRVRRHSDTVYIPNRDSGPDPRDWPKISCRDRRVLQLIRGRVQLIVHRL